MSEPSEMGVAVITGASSGIGAVYADRLAKRGYDLLIVARDIHRLEVLSERLGRETGRKIETMKADLNVKAELVVLEKRLGSDDTITMLVNNAGVIVATNLQDSDVDQLDSMIQLNVVSLTRLTQAVIPNFTKKGAGSILNVASVTGLAPELLNGVYSATKSYVIAYSQALKNELGAKGVRIQAVLPGATATELWDRAGASIDVLPKEMVMATDEMVDAALAGLDQGEFLTIPSLSDPKQWEALEEARKALAPHLSLTHAAARYGVSSKAV